MIFNVDNPDAPPIPGNTDPSDNGTDPKTKTWTIHFPALSYNTNYNFRAKAGTDVSHDCGFWVIPGVKGKGMAGANDYIVVDTPTFDVVERVEKKKNTKYLKIRGAVHSPDPKFIYGEIYSLEKKGDKITKVTTFFGKTHRHRGKTNLTEVHVDIDLTNIPAGEYTVRLTSVLPHGHAEAKDTFKWKK
jgi:hypothetical protein